VKKNLSEGTKVQADISVIIPVFNGENSLSISLDSLINQTYMNFEVIIIDDGSTDKTSTLVKKYSEHDSRFRYVYRENSGVAVSRNVGIREAKGRYVCFLDSDDYFENDYLEEMYKRIARNDDDVCYCGFNTVTPQKKTRRITHFQNGDILREYILGKVAVHTTGWMIKKEFLISNHVTFPNGVSWGEDFEFFCEVLANTNKVCYVNMYLTNYRIDFMKDRLSAFAIDKIDKDYESIQRVISNPAINKNTGIYNALIKYRLSALISFRLVLALKNNIERKIVLDYFNRYKESILLFQFNNGFRSIKLNIFQIYLFLRLGLLKK
jgi:glycosyltransferase involved in cell wall biosynthesis